MMERPAMEPMARPIPPRRRPPIAMQRPDARPLTPQPAPQRPIAEVPRSFQPVVQSILDVVLDGAVDIEDVFPKPQPRRDIPPLPPRAAKATGSKRPAKRRSIEEREEQKDKLVEKRIGHVEPRVAPATPLSPADFHAEFFERPTRKDLRRAIILNEILSPPLALRGQP
jgi:hypothetical protein